MFEGAGVRSPELYVGFAVEGGAADGLKSLAGKPSWWSDLLGRVDDSGVIRRIRKVHFQGPGLS
jgi:hypothetical protein